MEEQYNGPAYYLTPEDYATAELNGISKSVAYNRFYNLGWSVEDTTTIPTFRPDAERIKWRRVAQNNGIKRSTFNDRICKSGWSPEKAATTPVMTKEQRAKAARKRRLTIFTEEQANLAEANGIPLNTARQRVVGYGWSPQKAVTQPINTAFRSKTYGKDKGVEGEITK